MVTIFRNIKTTETPFFKDITYILGRIKSGTSKNLIKSIRSEKDKTEKNELKKELPAICFSGTFNKRSDSSIIKHSGFICLDFDGYKKKEDMMQAKDKYSKNKYVYSVFISPSGNGLKVLVKIPKEVENHKKYFNSLEKEFSSDYFDTTCKNISRVCYESYDPLIHINEKSVEWTDIEEDEYEDLSVLNHPPTIHINDENKVAEILIKWWTKKYPMIDGHRNNNLFTLAMAFNEFGINKSLALNIGNQYKSSSFPSSEIDMLVASAYRNKADHGTKFYEDKEAVDQIAKRIRRGESRDEVRRSMEDDMIDTEVIDSVLKRSDESFKLKFWSKSDKGKVEDIPNLFKELLQENGYYKYQYVGKNQPFTFVKVTNNLVSETTTTDIKDFVLNYLEELNDMTVWNYYAQQTRIFEEKHLKMIDTIDIYFLSDTKDTSYLYYRNCALAITKNSVRQIDYVDLDGYIWKDQIIDRVYKNSKVKNCDYKKFISNISFRDSDRIKSMESTIGFLLHDYKNASYCPAVILNDQVVSSNPEGGTGKGLFMNALGYMKNLVKIDGKVFSFDKSFGYQSITTDTRIISFDDVKKGFKFSGLFSVITEGITIERKNKDAVIIPFHKSPKVAITTNHAIEGSGNSFTRRTWELELYQHYSQTFTPEDDFGKLMFSDWDDNEWNVFDNYMIKCIQLYLSKGLIKSTSVNLAIRKLEQESCHQFVEWCGLTKGSLNNPKLDSGLVLQGQELYWEFTSEYPIFSRGHKPLSKTKFYNWIESYSIYKYGRKPIRLRNTVGCTFEFVENKPQTNLKF